MKTYTILVSVGDGWGDYCPCGQREQMGTGRQTFIFESRGGSQETCVYQLLWPCPLSSASILATRNGNTVVCCVCASQYTHTTSRIASLQLGSVKFVASLQIGSVTFVER